MNCPWNKEGVGESSPFVSPHTICWAISHFIHNHSVNCPWNKEEDGGIYHIQYVERYRILFITIQCIAHGIRRRMGESSPCVSPHTICWTISHFIHNHSVHCPWNKEGVGESSPCVSPHLKIINFACWVIFHAFVICWFFSQSAFSKNIFRNLSDGQAVWIQIRTDILSVCKGYQQLIKVTAVTILI